MYGLDGRSPHRAEHRLGEEAELAGQTLCRRRAENAGVQHLANDGLQLEDAALCGLDCGAVGTATRGKTIQEQIDRLTAEVGPPEPILPQVTEHEVVEIPESIPASQDTVIFSPSGRPLLNQDEPSPTDTPFTPKKKPHRATRSQHQAQQRRPRGLRHQPPHVPQPKGCGKQHLPGKPAPAARQAGEIFNTPPQPSAWFTANYTGVHTESGIVRWFGGLIRRTMPGVLREIQRATRPENLGVAAPHTEMAPQQRPTRPKGRRNGDDQLRPTAARATSATRQKHLKHTHAQGIAGTASCRNHTL